MRPSRGMGAVKASKMPKAKTITRKDDPNEVTMYAKGGKVKKYAGGSPDTVKGDFDRIKDITNRPRPKPEPKKEAPIKLTPEQRRAINNETMVGRAKGGKLDIAKAIKKPGALRASLGTKKGETIPAKKLAKAAKAPGKLGQRARFAEMLKGFRKK
jgi:hypothetical protein